MTSNKRLIWISFAVSIISLIVSIIVLVNYCPTQNLKFDYMGVIVGILALLVTSLIGAQVGQYVFVDRKIEKITRTLARVISRKVAQEEARVTARNVAEETAKETASESVKKMQDDLRHISTASNYIVEAKIAFTLCNDTKYLVKVLATVEEYMQIDDKELSNTLVDKFLTEHLANIEQMKADGELKVRDEHMPVIKEFLSESDFPQIEKLRELLLNAKTISAEEEPHEISHFRN